MHKKTLIKLVLTAATLYVTGCGSPDRSFIETPGGDLDSSKPDVPSGTGNDGAGDTTAADAPGMDARTDAPATDARPDTGSSSDAADAGTDAGRDATSDLNAPDAADANIDVPLDSGAPDIVVIDATSDPTGDSSNDAGDAASDTADAANDWYDDGNCTGTPPPTISTSGPTAICPGGSVTLTSSSAASYLWSNGQTTQAIAVTAAGSYSVVTTDNRGCVASSAPTAVTVYPAPLVPTISPSGSTRFCTGGSVTLTASSAASYLWSTGATSQSIIVTDSGTFTVTTTNIDGCAATSAPISTTRVVPPTGTQTFNYIGAVDSFTVPECVTSLTVNAYGAQGGSGAVGTGGWGGRVQATITVVPLSSLSVRVGGAGINCSVSNTPGYNGGGVGNCTNARSSSGGGSTDLRAPPHGIGNRIIVAGGGGGSGYNCGTTPENGGAGGGLVGQRLPPSTCGSYPDAPGGGGSQVSGGIGGTAGPNFGNAGMGGLGFGGTGVSSGGSITPSEGGGGGSGYYGGGGGCYAGGGGGSSFVAPSGSSGITHWQGVKSGNGQLVINW